MWDDNASTRIAETTIDFAIKRSRFVAQFFLLEDDDAAIATPFMELPEARDKPFFLATGYRYALWSSQDSVDALERLEKRGGEVFNRKLPSL